MLIEQAIEQIANKYVREYAGDKYYSYCRYDAEENEYDIINEIEEYLNSVHAVYKIEFTEGCSSCGYDNDFVAIAWLKNGQIRLRTILLENF